MPSDHVKWGEINIAYSYRYTRSRTLSITIHPDLAVEVAAPEGTSRDVIRSKVLKRGAWIANAWREYSRFHPLQPPRQYIPGETHRYLGRQYRLRFVEGVEVSVALRRGYLDVTSPGPPTSELLRPLVIAWYEQRAAEILRERFDACYRISESHRIPPPRLAVRAMATRWGSCSKGGQVTLNPELIKTPKDCIDYVITHELCHLVEYNHSPRFWKLLQKLMPDWEERRERLNRIADI
ncbi:M48 family metallopeptidase [Pyxidicoccus sp. MSG2]|uniref:M48 family metallopeptidase n=1 Tax=Pyxidicoccus sp. MSG2 TaxID=2996790 RepID=UPI00226FDA57|nr:SprT family zinc-dependent metalloprotease [Pyxidicoccus sp. MSG2]MCY1019692.1 SprT family zinc-dependent metalloprotease [Pyxidicoccus sp. MSG2]